VSIVVLFVWPAAKKNDLFFQAIFEPVYHGFVDELGSAVGANGLDGKREIFFHFAYRIHNILGCFSKHGSGAEE
jgi:hypothetical protein